ncbi:MAG: hypothetical protein QOI03_1574, partial [Solirubrobacteraceae bacterium]|nr:hypothetical protein [Solirubrobacteraceae bacterium]
MSDDALAPLVHGLAEAVTPLAQAFHSPEEFAAFVGEMGWVSETGLSVDALKQAFGTLPADVTALVEGAPAVEVALQARDRDAIIAAVRSVIALVQRLTGTITALKAPGAAAGLPRPLNSPDFWARFPREIIDHLIFRYLEDYPRIGDGQAGPQTHTASERRLRRPHVSSLFAPLRLLGVLRWERVAGDRDPATQRRVVDWDALLGLVVDPIPTLVARYRSGTSFDSAAFDDALRDAALALEFALLPEETGSPAVARYWDDAASDAHDSLSVPLWSGSDDTPSATTIARVALGIVPIPASGQRSGQPDGLAVLPEVSVGEAVDVELAPGVRLAVSGAIEAAGGLALELRRGGATVEAGGIGQGKASIVVTGAPASPWIAIGSPVGTRVEIAKAHLALRVAEATASAFEVTIEAGLDEAHVVLEPADLDGFLATILGGQRHQFDFATVLAWSNLRGLTLGGRPGLSVEIPVRETLAGVLTVDTVTISLAGDPQSHAGALTIAATGSLQLGPVTASVQGVGLQLALSAGGSGNLGVADLQGGFKPPEGIGLVVDAGPVSGGGTLGFEPERAQYAGEMQLQFEGIAVRALGLLTTRLPDGKPGFSLLVIVSAEFPPVQLGLGFSLVGVGGLLGINRTVAVEALRAGLKTGALGAVLSPPDPKASAGQLVASLAGLFPPAVGRHVFGPTARIVWGAPTLITIDLCLVLELPAPVRLVVLGRLRAVLPDEHEAIVRIQVDMLGVINFDRGEAAVDATLVDSRLAQFALTGDMALRMSWGEQSSFLLAVGGFHPRFAAPPGFPALARVAVALASGDNPKLRLEAYLALTSNTVQFGARVDLAARAGSFSIAGFLSFDALVTLEPLAFVVDIAAKLAVKAGGHTLFSVSLALTLSGPRPWHAHGRASFSILFFDVSFGFDVTIGDDAPPVLPAPVDVAALVVAAFADPRSWSAQLPTGGAALVTLRALEPGTAVLVHPLATLQVRQRVAPLERTLERFGTSVPSGAKRFKITLATIGGVRTTLSGLQDQFAPAQFFTLSDDAKLSAPSFVAMASGAVLG